eukprot:TRINITY_DN11409_c0_g1_i2.p1 TRINITY_DN11409_c0_g1~~TRINITY_DN11409_c0_g1_i2.p1  ORF type:complete len:600 (+),score=156.54 TRINITY_DN11409_c0_g1_i2:140-1801(+)
MAHTRTQQANTAVSFVAAKHTADHDPDTEPLLVSFVDGPAPSSLLERAMISHNADAMDTEEDELGATTQVHVLAPKKRKSEDGAIGGEASKRRFVAIEGEDVLFHSVQSTHMDSPKASYFVGVYDKTTNEVEIRPLREGMVPMLRKVKGVHGTEDKETDAPLQRSELVKAFGSAKSKRMLNQKREYRIDAENTAGEVVTIDLNKYEDAKEKKETIYAALIPPADTTTTNPLAIYRLSDLLPKACQQLLVDSPLSKKMISFALQDSPSMDEMARVFASPQELARCNEKDLPPFMSLMVAKSMRVVGKANEGKHRKRLAAVLLYLLALIKFHRFLKSLRGSLPRQSAKLAQLINVPTEIVDEIILPQFTEKRGGSIAMTDELRVKLVNYIVVLSLLCNDCEIQGGPLLHDLELSEREATRHCKTVGCKAKIVRNIEGTRYQSVDPELHLLKGGVMVVRLVAPFSIGGSSTPAGKTDKGAERETPATGDGKRKKKKKAEPTPLSDGPKRAVGTPAGRKSSASDSLTPLGKHPGKASKKKPAPAAPSSTKAKLKKSK